MAKCDFSFKYLNIFGTTIVPNSSQQLYLALNETVRCDSTREKPSGIGLAHWDISLLPFIGYL